MQGGLRGNVGSLTSYRHPVVGSCSGIKNVSLEARIASEGSVYFYRKDFVVNNMAEDEAQNVQSRIPTITFYGTVVRYSFRLVLARRIL